MRKLFLQHSPLPADEDGGNVPPLRCREPSKSRTLARDQVKQGVGLQSSSRETRKKSIFAIYANQLVSAKVNSAGLPRQS